MSTPVETQARISTVALAELFRRHAKIETAQEQLSGVTGRRHSLASSIASAEQQLAVLKAEIARLESEDAVLSHEQTKLEAWLGVNVTADDKSLDDQIFELVTSIEPATSVSDVEVLPGRGRFQAIDDELQRSGWADDGRGLLVRYFSAIENTPPAGYVYVQTKANVSGPILTEAGEYTLIVGVAMTADGDDYEMRSDLRRKVLDDLNGSVAQIVSKLNVKADELIDAALEVAETRRFAHDLRTPSDDLRDVFEEVNCGSDFVAPVVFPSEDSDAPVVVGHLDAVLDEMPGFAENGIAANEIDEVHGFVGLGDIPESAYEEIPGFVDDVGTHEAPEVKEPEYQFNF